MIREGLYLEQKFDFLIANFIEFESALLESAIHDMVLSGQDYTWFAESRASFDRRIMNLLTTARTFTDSVPQHVNRFFNRDPVKTSTAEGYFSTEYDGRIGYRTMCALRNFVQHQGFPVHGSGYGASRVGEGEGRKMRFTVDPYLRPAELREGDFKRSVLVELESMGKEIDLKFLVRDFVEGLSAATGRLREMVDATINDAAATLETAIKSFEDEFPSEGSIIGLAAVRVDADQNFNDELAIIRGPNEYRLRLRNKNSTLVNLTRRYVSSEVTNSEVLSSNSEFNKIF
jgi:hypothetical protein